VEKVLDDSGIIARVVLLDGAPVGSISRFPADGEDHVGYWIDRAYWGTGIASRALHFLQKCGFVIDRVRLSPASDRFPECEEAVLTLR